MERAQRMGFSQHVRPGVPEKSTSCISSMQEVKKGKKESDLKEEQEVCFYCKQVVFMHRVT